MVDLHLLSVEGCYADGVAVASTLRARISKLNGQVLFLLHVKPDTRGDNEFLRHWWNVKFGHTEYYDPNTQSFQPRTDIEPTKLQDLKFQVKPESLSRLKRDWQLQDKQLYHKKHINELGKIDYLPEWEISHDCILPTAQTQLKHNLEATESRKYWAQNTI